MATVRPTLLQRLRQSARSCAPAWYRDLRRAQLLRRHDTFFHGKQPEEVFSHIYENDAWGAATDPADYFSGTGSHEAAITDPYVNAVTAYLRTLPRAPDVVDLGCGDFHVGSRIRPACARYIACDVVPGLIEANRRRYVDHDVEFRCIDASRDDLPPGDIVFVRQVLQHLDNARIASVLGQVRRYQTLVLTEHLPLAHFQPNADKVVGATTRLMLGAPSGVVVTAPPFNLRAVSARVLCEVREGDGIIQTTVYELAQAPMTYASA